MNESIEESLKQALDSISKRGGVPDVVYMNTGNFKTHILIKEWGLTEQEADEYINNLPKDPKDTE